MEFEECIGDQYQSSSVEELKPSLYPLTNATNYALKRINSSSAVAEMSVTFEDQSLSVWMCSHGLTFHRGYTYLDKDITQWSSSFKLLIQLSCIVLHCNVNQLIPIINRME